MPHPLNFKNSVWYKNKAPASGHGFIFLFIGPLHLSLRFRFRQFFDQYFVDAGAVHINNLEAVAIPQEVVAGQSGYARYW